MFKDRGLAALINCGLKFGVSAIPEISIFDPGKPFECNTHWQPVALIILEIGIT